MKHETEIKLFAMLSQELDVQALQSDMQDIEHIVCADDLQLLAEARSVIKICYEAMNLQGTSEILNRIEARLSEMLPVSHIPT